MIVKSQLNNGIRVITENIPHAHSVSIGIWVTNGSRHDRREHNGVAHFIEHLLFKGTAKRSALDIAREIDSVGGVLNAFTCREYLCFYAKVLSDALPKAVDLLADIFLNSAFDTSEVEKERKVILQEIRMIKDSPDNYIHELFCQSFWKSHPLGMSIVGTEESVSGMSRDTLISTRYERFKAEDIIISAAGNLKHAELISLLGTHFNEVPSGYYTCPGNPPCYEKQVRVLDKNLEQIHLCLGTKALPQDSPLRYAGYILNTVLGGSISSRLFQEVREKQGLAYSVYSYVLSHSDAGTMVVYAGTKPDKLTEVIEIVLNALRTLKSEPVSPTEMTFASEHLKGNLLLSLENNDNRMTKLAKNEIYFGRQIPIDEILNGLKLVSSEDVMELAAELFQGDYLTLELLGKVGSRSITPEALCI
ncbi:MAG: pitrilysin family protein [Geobacteraceae bacterium]|nr:pitrilysin family protein [Geobacteraceae bacterium]